MVDLGFKLWCIDLELLATTHCLDVTVQWVCSWRKRREVSVDSGAPCSPPTCSAEFVPGAALPVERGLWPVPAYVRHQDKRAVETSPYKPFCGLGVVCTN